MDVEVARTFLEIVKCGSFVKAAERLFVTQTAVSARIQGLEQQLDVQLFSREKTGTRLTPAGEKFVPFANQLVQAWDTAREEVPLSSGLVDQLSVGSELSLWDPYLINWLVGMRASRPEIRLRAEVDVAEHLTQRVSRGGLDIALVYIPDYAPGLGVELLLEEKLVLVTTERQGHVDADRYIRVDWGREFLAKHDAAFPDRKSQSLFVGLGPLALQFILRAGGSGYFRTRAVSQHLASGRLKLVQDMPEFTYPVYAVYRSADNKLLEPALAEFRRTLADPANPWGEA